MRVLALCEKSYRGVTPSGGAETTIADMMEILSSSGWDSEVIILNGSYPEVTLEGVRIRSGLHKEDFHQAVKNADIVICQLGSTPRAKATAVKYGTPVVQLIHNTSDYSIGFLADGCDYAIYNSQWVSDFHEEAKADKVVASWQDRNRSIVRSRRCHNWPSMVLHPPVQDYQGSGMADGYITLINLTPNKGPDVFYALAEKNPDLQFMAVTGGYEESRQVYSDLTNVFFQGHTKEISRDVYQKTSILLVPSIYESYGRVAVEAMAHGIPVIATATPGLIECLESYTLIEDRTNIDSWQSALERTRQYRPLASNAALGRFADLKAQSEKEVLTFVNNMEELVNSWHSSP